MKRTHLALLVSLTAAPSLAMEVVSHDFLTPEEVLQQSKTLPKELTETTKWVSERKDVFRHLQLPQANSDKQLREAIIKSAKENATFRVPNIGKHNFIYPIDGRFVVRTAGFISQLHSKISSSRIDPISKNIVEVINKKPCYQDGIVKTATHCAAPCHQATSMIAYYLLMKKRLQGKKVQSVATYPVQYGNSTKLFHDGNYVVVQPYLGQEYITADKLEAQELNQLIGPELLDDLADTVDAGAWNLNLPNLWVRKQDETFWITDLEKPNNEGFGPQAKWKTAVLNNGPGTEEARARKWDHNRQEGFSAVRGSILEPLHDKADMQQRWDRIKEERMKK